MATLADFSAVDIDGAQRSLREYAGRVVLIVNVASRCGFTPQYEGLEALYREHVDAGFTVLGFPCDQFRHQEPGDEAEIKRFCALHYDVTFPLFAKIDVNGEHAHPLYRWLKRERPGLLGTQGIKWNFTKFLVGRDGLPIRRYGPADKPAAIAPAIVAACSA
ncbi:glutathione peroxidase [Bordetella genomosp. 8]|uniref:Glutathione peroxidase n=1 Tax=Bordetella genomosp. 8 TaxID=1416806 RepID=A0A1W6YLW5_9BORD|nr:glutathione peroxidase [Bordetella genomosp. 8]ARP82096.1 glutathione peroxidase [Bordetella genomosp. 8]